MARLAAPVSGGVLLRPAWLLVLPVVLLMAVRAGRAGALGGWRAAVDAALLAALLARGHALPGRRRGSLVPALLAVLLTLALAGPAARRAGLGTYRNLDGLVLVFDASRSVALGGSLPEARLLAAAAAAAASRPAALIAYAGDAYTVSGFGSDPEVLDGLLAALDGDTVPDAGSRPERALALAHRMLRGARMVRGDVLLLSDGGGIGPSGLAEAASLRADGDTVHTLLVTATAALPSGAPVPDRAAMAWLAAAGGGLAGDLATPGPLLHRLREAPARRLARTEFSALVYADLGRWLLTFCLLPAGLLFRRSW